MVIRTNISAIDSNRVLNINDLNMKKDAERLSSGKRINSAADDAVGLAISQKMTTQFRGLKQSVRNVEDGISFLQTTEGYLKESVSLLQRLREISIQAANGIYKQEDRVLLQEEMNQLVSEIDRIAEQGQFNQFYPLNGEFEADPLVLHVGANTDENVSINIPSINSQKLGVADLNVDTTESANQNILLVDQAISSVVETRVNIGSIMTRMESIIRSENIAFQNLVEANSRILDADMAEEMSNFTRDNVLLQASTAMLAQANAKSQNILQLLRA